jgi:hypothetical protein
VTAGDGFLSRWSRRKAGARDGAAVADPPIAPAAASATAVPALPTTAETPAPGAPGSAPAAAVAEPPPLPTLDDVAALTHASDFSPFVARGVDAGVRNAAMKKLFSDPHFNVMDGLDTYIDDYGKPDPIPLSMLRRMNQSAALGLFADEAAPATPDTPIGPQPAEASPDGAESAAMAQSTPPATLPAVSELPADDDPDLQLQPDDADRRAGTGPGPRG